MLDSAIHQINHYPVGKYYGNQYYTNRWIVIYPVDSATQRLNNWGLVIIICYVADMGWERGVTGVTERYPSDHHTTCAAFETSLLPPIVTLVIKALLDF